MLKNVLAMANAWRDTDAYILIGVQEQAGKAASIGGIDDHLDDADLQQFVNSKTNRPIQFSYAEFAADGTTVAVIHIPKQQRPFFLTKRFGGLEANTVYVKRGSSTDVADPDEVFRMGADAATPPAPRLVVAFADVEERQQLGTTLSLKRLILKALDDKELPQIKRSAPPFGSAVVWLEGDLNDDYWRELRDDTIVRNVLGKVGFCVMNMSAVVAQGVRLELMFPQNDAVSVLDEHPPKPVERRTPNLYVPRVGHRDVYLEKLGLNWHLEIAFGKVQPGATAWTRDELWIGTVDSRELVIEGQMFSDNFAPVQLKLTIVSEPTARPMSLDDLRIAKAEHDRDV